MTISAYANSTAGTVAYPIPAPGSSPDLATAAPKEEYALGQLAGMLKIAPSTMHQEVERLVRAGLIAGRQVGRNRLLRANTSSRLIPALTDLLTMSFGPSVVVGEEFANVCGVDQVLIYGSWKAASDALVAAIKNSAHITLIGEGIGSAA